MRATQVECPDCEGTGKAVNRFDPPKYEDPDRISMFIDTTRRTRTGYECYDRPCCQCEGSGRITIVLPWFESKP